MRPILEKFAPLEPTGRLADMPPVWWIGTGIASSLPFHAAGDYGIGSSGNKQNCLSLVISSYTPSIKSLRHARKNSSSRTKRLAQGMSVLVATMPETPGFEDKGSLPSVEREQKVIKKIVNRAWEFRPMSYPTVSEVLEEVQRFNIVHFACHGQSDLTNPLDSHLLLQRGKKPNAQVDKLTVAALLEVTAEKQAWIAYLSACSTAEVKASSLSDESLHLTSAFQIAGFAHVIGSLWSANDEVCVLAAKYFYMYLQNPSFATDPNRVVAEALHSAVQHIARDNRNEPHLGHHTFTWEPRVRFGW